MKSNPILVLIREIHNESENAIHCFAQKDDKSLSRKLRTLANDDYVNSVRNINSLSHAIEKLNQA